MKAFQGISAVPSPRASESEPINLNPDLRILVYLVIYDSGQVSLEHLLLSWYPPQSLSADAISLDLSFDCLLPKPTLNFAPQFHSGNYSIFLWLSTSDSTRVRVGTCRHLRDFVTRG